ncbi:MAG: hypothetical protein ABIH23_29420 [bacterium]
MIEELFLNGILEEETDRYYHICFFGAKGVDKDRVDNYVFIPKVVCRIAGPRTVAVQAWYAKKYHLTRFAQKYLRGEVQVDMDKIRMRQAARTIRRKEGA